MSGQGPSSTVPGGSVAAGIDTALFDQLSESVSVHRPDGTYLYVNPVAERLLGQPRDAVVGRTLWELFPDVVGNSLHQSFHRVAETGQAEEFEYFAATWRRWFVSRLVLSHGRIHLFARDITMQKEKDDALRLLYEETRRAERHAAFLARASEVLVSSLEYEEILQRLTRLAVPTLADGCCVDVPTPEGAVRRVAVAHVHPELVELTHQFHARYPIRVEDEKGIGSVLRTGVTDFVPDIPQEFAALLEQDEERRRATRALGVRSYVSVPLVSRGRVMGALTLVNTEEGRRLSHADVRLAEDLARRAAASLDNGRLYKEAQEAIQARDTFLSVASHELNTPLTSLLLNVQALRREFEPRGDATSAKVNAVQRQVARLSSLVRELLDVSRITAGRLRLEREELDLASLALDVVPRFSEDLARAGCELRVSASEPVLGQWDRLRLEQVLQNLLSNAIKYGRGQPVEVEVGGDAERAWLRVKDQGMGIPPEGQARLFQRFERLASEKHYGGLGLGLWIVKQIVDALGGRIRVESEPGKGSVFTVELPRQPPG